METIRFYGVHEPFGDFSNFAEYPISLRGRQWPTVEHYFQAQKFRDPKAQENVRRANSPILAARLGRDRKTRLRPDWETAKVAVMREALEAKFTQHEKLKELLLSTGDAKLVEHTENDDFWGDGGDGCGQNILGRLLMDLRDRLRDSR